MSLPRSVILKAPGILLGALALASAGGAFAGCSDGERAPTPLPVAGKAGSSGHAGNVPVQAGVGGREDGAANEGGGAAAGGSHEGGAPLGSGGDAHVGPPNVGGDPGLDLDACPSDALATPPNLAGVCSASQKWGSGTAVTVVSGAAPSFVAVTPNELTLLWSEASGSVPVYFVADRASANEAFGDPQELPFARVLALSPDGLRLTVSNDDGNLAEATRTALGDSFGNAELGAYETLDTDRAAQHLMLGDVALAADDRTLFYGAWSLEDETPYPVRVSQRSGNGPWPIGVALQACELKAYGAFGPHPTGVSADGLTLFYFDGARGTARAAFRASLAADFSWFAELPDLAAPQPNAACDRLYFSPTTGVPRLLVAARQP